MQTKGQAFLLVTRLLVLSLAVVACQSKPPQASPTAHRYEIKGKVVSFDRASKKVTIDHQAIPGYMDAMTMPFTLIDEWAFSDLLPGADIQATLVVDTGRTWIESPVIVSPGPGSGKEVVIEPRPGDDVPDFALVNQDGKKIDLRQYRGSTLLLTFIYTRCPLPDYCPLMSGNFAEINRAFEKNAALGSRTHLLSITVDPVYDRPKVLRSYAAQYLGTGSFKRWEFATGTPEEVKAIAQFFGLSYWPEKDQIIHSLRTVIVGPDGKVVKVYRGNEWKPADVLKELESVPSAQKAAKAQSGL